MIPEGKGVFLWNVERCDPSPDKTALVERLRQAGVQRVDIKIVDGATRYGTDKETGFNHTAAAIRALRKAGFALTGWAYTYGYSRDWVTKEAQAVVAALRDYEIDTFAVDAETEYKRADHYKYAQVYCRTIKEALPGLTMGLTSYRFPYYHQDFPWGAFWPYTDYHMPQVYWINAHNPAAQLQKSVNDLRTLHDVPFVPAGYGYGSVLPEEMNTFDGEVKRLGFKGITWWEWYYIDSDPALFEALRSHQWGTAPQPEPPEQPGTPGPENKDALKRIAVAAERSAAALERTWEHR